MTKEGNKFENLAENHACARLQFAQPRSQGLGGAPTSPRRRKAPRTSSQFALPA